MTDRRNKGYIPWHEKVDEDLVREITREFVQRIYKEAGMRVSNTRVNWSEDGRDFDAQTYGRPIGEKPPP